MTEIAVNMVKKTFFTLFFLNLIIKIWIKRMFISLSEDRNISRKFGKPWI